MKNQTCKSSVPNPTFNFVLGALSDETLRDFYFQGTIQNGGYNDDLHVCALYISEGLIIDIALVYNDDPEYVYPPLPLEDKIDHLVVGVEFGGDLRFQSRNFLECLNEFPDWARRYALETWKIRRKEFIRSSIL